MSDHSHYHHHHPGHAHPSATVRPSILRLSGLQRLIAASGVVAVLWAIVFWAVR